MRSLFVAATVFLIVALGVAGVPSFRGDSRGSSSTGLSGQSSRTNLHYSVPPFDGGRRSKKHKTAVGAHTITPLESLFPDGVFPDTIPRVLDWRKKGYVTTPVDGSQCGGTEIADAETTNIAGQIAVQNAVPVVPLSYQELIDCKIGCGPSSLGAGVGWAIANNSGHIATAASYISGTGGNKCNPTSGTTGATVSGYHHLPKHETLMAYAVARLGPIVVAIDARALQTYTSGVLVDCPANEIDDGATLVGYNTQAVPPYWILKNSWGTAWGLEGYAYIGFGNNTCGVTTDPSTAKVDFN